MKTILAAVVALLVGAGAVTALWQRDVAAERERARAQQGTLESELAKARADLATEKNRAATAEQKLSELGASLESTKTRAISDLAAAESKAKDLYARAQTLEADAAKAKADAVAALTSAESAAREKLDAAKAELAGAKAEAQTLTERLQKGLGEATAAAKNEIDRLNGLVKDRDKTAQDLKGQLDGKLRELAASSEAVQAAKRETEAVKAKVDEANARIASLEKAVYALTIELEAQRTQNGGGIKGLFGGKK